MKKLFTIILALMMVLTLSACVNEVKTDEKSSDAKEITEVKPTPTSDSTQKITDFNEKKILIAYFSRADENTRVGVIEKGNTRILAEMLQGMTGGDIFEIKNVKPYPKEYKETTDIAKQEKEINFRPEIVEPLPNVQEYDVILLGYPIWWSDLPMAVYTFLEKENFNGKVIAPFCTHEGSGIAGTEGYIAEITNARMLSGLEMRGSVAQNSPEEAKEQLENWLKNLEVEFK